jgi:4-amino-4-deoxy-L-arabinose transferase-like glycosyltransferase
VTDKSRPAWTEEHFGRLLTFAVAIAALIRFRYVLTDRRVLIGGDAYDYHLSALRLADGLGYTSAFGDVGRPIAHHPPGWVTVLGVVSWLGARSQRDHQLVGIIIGLGVVALAGLVGRRYFNARTGVIAAVLAALYPGFWVLEGNILSEPLGLLALGCLMLVIASLRDRPTLSRSVMVGAACGVVALVRSEQALLFPIVIVPTLIRARTLTRRQQAILLAGAAFAFGAVIAPWTIYNETRFKSPVLLSTNDGGLLLAGNCPPATYSGKYLGFYGGACVFQVASQHPGFDRSQQDRLDRSAAVHNIVHNLDKMPVVVFARFGRALAIFRPSQTVGYVAAWMTTGRRPIWAWAISYWFLLPLAVIGGIHARRTRAYVLPLVGPLIVVCVSVAISYGEPRYHTPSDLGVVVFAAVAIDRVVARMARRSQGAAATDDGDPSPMPQPVGLNARASGTRTDDSDRTGR